MNKQETLEAIKVMQAWCEGKDVEVKHIFTSPVAWLFLSREATPSWNWQDFEYRIKSQPMEIQVWVNPQGGLGRLVEQDEPHSADGWTKKKFREVSES